MPGKLKPLDVAREVMPGNIRMVTASTSSSSDRRRNWSYRYWFKGKECWHGLGSMKDISLKDARIKRDAARQQVRDGVDIVQAK